MSLNELSDDLIDAIRSAFDARKRAAEQERRGPEGYWNDDISVMKQSVSGALLKLADGNGYLHVALYEHFTLHMFRHHSLLVLRCTYSSRTLSRWAIGREWPDLVISSHLISHRSQPISRLEIEFRQGIPRDH